MGWVGAAIAFALGLWLKPRGSGVALRVVAVLAILVAIWSRYEWATTHRASAVVMLTATAALTLLSGALALIGPSVFGRWHFALMLSGVLVLGFHLLPSDSVMCVLLGVCRP